MCPEMLREDMIGARKRHLQWAQCQHGTQTGRNQMEIKDNRQPLIHAHVYIMSETWLWLEVAVM